MRLTLASALLALGAGALTGINSTSGRSCSSARARIFCTSRRWSGPHKRASNMASWYGALDAASCSKIDTASAKFDLTWVVRDHGLEILIEQVLEARAVAVERDGSGRAADAYPE